MTINSIEPLMVRSGVGDVIVISGSGFGSVPGKVLFRNADRPILGLNGPSNYLTNLDDFYYDTSDPNGDNPTGWKDDEIRVIVPSWVPSAEGEEPPGACSGKIRVQHADGSLPVTSDEVLTIEYAIANHSRNTADLDKNPVRYGFVGMEHCLSGHVFTLHNSFKGNEQDKIDARASVEAVLAVWRSTLDITLELEKKPNGDYVYVKFPDDPNKHRIVVSFGENNALMSVSTGFQNDLWGVTTAYRRVGGRILIADDVNWEYRHTGDLAAGKYDFYAAFLHEVGHIIGVHHSVMPMLDVEGEPTEQIDFRNIMTFARPAPNITIPADNRLNLTNFNNDKTAVEGNLLVVNDSRNYILSDVFKDMYGVETLAAEENLSMVQPTPVIKSNLIGLNENGHAFFLRPTHFDHFNGYYWREEVNGELEEEVVANYRFKWACEGAENPVSTHFVRIRDNTCTISSPYSLPKTIGNACLGLERDDDNSAPINQPLINIYPNPTKGHFNIQFNPIEGEEVPYIEDTYIGVYDNLGNLQKQYNVGDTLRQTTIDISTLPAGTYWVVWFVGGEVIETKQVYKN